MLILLNIYNDKRDYQEEKSLLMVTFTKGKFKSWKGKMTSIKKEKKFLFMKANKSGTVYRRIEMFPLRIFRVRLHIPLERCSLDQVHITDVGKRRISSSHWILSADEFGAFCTEVLLHVVH